MSKKSLIAIIVVIALAIGTVLFFMISGTDSNNEEKTNTKGVTSEAEKEAPSSKEASEEQKADDGNADQQEEKEEVKGKYSDNEVYKDEAGTEYSKTESGTEVELSGENFQALMEEYEKVKGTGSEREKELLDQIQVIMDIMASRSPQ